MTPQLRTEHGVVPRPYRDESDWWRIRALLIHAHRDAEASWDWDVRRWDGWRFHREHPTSDTELAMLIGLWETDGGDLLGAVHPEDPGEAFIEIRPDARWLEPEMVRWAEEHLAAASPIGRGRKLTFFVGDDDEVRQAVLRERGYQKQSEGGWLRSLRFADWLPPNPVMDHRYQMRTTRVTDDDAARIADLLNAAFGRTVHTAREYLTFMERSPSFDADLNLVAVAPDGTFASHVGLTLEPESRHGIVEPVCTHPSHRRAGLAAALILEGEGRLLARGAESASVETGDQIASNTLYAACGFEAARHYHAWSRSI